MDPGTVDTIPGRDGYPEITRKYIPGSRNLTWDCIQDVQSVISGLRVMIQYVAGAVTQMLLPNFIAGKSVEYVPRNAP